MSPYPAQTNRDAIIQTAKMLIERDGVDGLLLSQVAAELGIKSPSLYRHFSSKAALIQAVIEHAFDQLYQAYEGALRNESETPKDRLLEIFRAHRDFAHANPNTYILAYTATAPELRTDPDKLEKQAISIQKIMSQISGEQQSLSALRGALALVHGYVMLELKNQFQRGGDLRLAFEASVSAYLRGWEWSNTTKDS
jgi:AcrR family transcriptional regulator